MSLPAECIEFVDLFNRERYFEAHEVLEALWLREKGEARRFYQGMIQTAAVFVHIQKKNSKGAEMMYEKAHQNLKSYLPQYLNLNIQPMLQDVAQCVKNGTAYYQLNWR